MKNKYLLLLWSFFTVVTIFAQGAPLVKATVTQDVAVCDLLGYANLHVDYNTLVPTTSYAMVNPPASQPFRAYPFTGGTNILVPPAPNNDDFWSTQEPLNGGNGTPFEFSFYGNTYTSVQM